MLSPSQHIPIDDPILKRLVAGIGVECSNVGVAVCGEINLREVLHALLIAIRSLECFLEQPLSFFPCLSHLWIYPLQLAPFPGQASIFPLYSYGTSEERRQVLRNQFRLKIRAPHIASTVENQPMNVANSQTQGNSLSLDILLAKIETFLQIIHAAPPLCNTITGKQSDTRITLPLQTRRTVDDPRGVRLERGAVSLSQSPFHFRRA